VVDRRLCPCSRSWIRSRRYDGVEDKTASQCLCEQTNKQTNACQNTHHAATWVVDRKNKRYKPVIINKMASACRKTRNDRTATILATNRFRCNLFYRATGRPESRLADRQNARHSRLKPTPQYGDFDVTSPSGKSWISIQSSE